MDHMEYTAFAKALTAVPDPRQARGQRYPWELLVVLIGAALLSGEQHGRAIGQWVAERTEKLSEWLGWDGVRLPSEATLRRAVQAMDLVALEACLTDWIVPQCTADETELTGIAIDGKWVRGAGAHGREVHLLSTVQHDGLVLEQTAVPAGSNEITVAPSLLAGYDLAGTVITADALLSQRELAAQILAQGSDYLLPIKGNQPESQEAIAALFDAAPWQHPHWPDTYQHHTSVEKGHGRLEQRTLEASPILNAWLRWPAVGQVLKRTCRRTELSTGELTESVTYAVTSLPVGTDLAAIAQLWRGHWTIENRVHYIRDVTFGEDAGQAYRGNTPQVLAALRNAVLNLLRLRGWTRIADALRHFAAHPTRALAALGVNPS